jgi:hypothetical protein
VEHIARAVVRDGAVLLVREIAEGYWSSSLGQTRRR